MAHDRTFIIPGNIHPHLAMIRESLNGNLCGVMLHEDIDVAEAVKQGVCPPELADRLYSWKSLRVPSPTPPAVEDREVYERCLKAILGDPRVHYLATRTELDSAFNNAILIEKAVMNSVLILRKTNPARLVSTSTPHSLEAWIFARCCEELGIPVFILERTPINNRAWIYRGLDTQDVVPRANGAVHSDLTPYTQQQVREQRDAMAGARDAKGFLVSRMDLSSVKGAAGNRWWSWRRELGMLFEGRLIPSPYRLASIYKKRQLLQSYERVATHTLPSGPFVIFFMHYQPERSSLPEGLFHVQQWLAIRLISMTLPPGWTLLVREHPTTWLLPLDISARTATLFDEIASLPNTQVCSMDVDTFELIDRCAVVSTLTGSVGFQALLRNKPVIVFGLPAYKDHPACLHVESVSQLSEAFRRLTEEDFSKLFTDEALTRYLLWVEQNSIVADVNETDWLAARLKNVSVFYGEILRGEIAL